ncbi:MAG: hypothetical protein M1375_00180 [Candidatus Thermoplasmatota archaeon]|jgi:hypothetical protein|nr:hypothetical protein [Candidatus Thermoplasmatota archaeon]MCL5790378.1 hypothetical protein [Candidatus Thermoplasmatota archaeon]
MRIKITFLLSATGGIIFFLVFILTADSNIGYVLASLFLVFFLYALLHPASSKDGTNELGTFSKVKFFLFLFPILAVVFSSGYVGSFVPSLSAINPSSSGLLSLFLIVMEFALIAMIADETVRKISRPMIQAGYDPEEIDTELQKFSMHVSEIETAVLLVSFGFILLLVFSPEVNIGIFPAIVIFLVVYAVVIGNMIRRN